MRRASATASSGAVTTNSWPGARPRPTRTAISARRSRRAAWAPRGASARMFIAGSVRHRGPAGPGSEMPPLRVRDQKVTEDLHAGHAFHLFWIYQVAIDLGHVGFRQ